MKTLREIREAVQQQLEEGVVVSADYKISPKTGRKVRAHRRKMGGSADEFEIDPEDEVSARDVDKKTKNDDENNLVQPPKGKKAKFDKFYDITKVVEETEIIDEKKNDSQDPPFVLLLKRKQIRLYPNGVRVALYHNQKLNKYFTVPYGKGVDGTSIQAEEVEHLEEAKEVMDHIHDIVNTRQSKKVKFGNGKSALIDGYTASAVKQVHDAVNDENKEKLRKMVHQSPEGLKKVASFAFSRSK